MSSNTQVSFMNNIRNMFMNISNKITSIRIPENFKIIWIFYTLLFIITFYILYYIFNNYISNKLNPDYLPNLEFSNKNMNKVNNINDNNNDSQNYATMYLLHVGWCPYSKKALPIWNDLKAKYNNQKVNNYILLFKEIDGDNENDIREFQQEFLAGKGNIDAFPSIYMVKDDQIIEYEATPNSETFEEFINNVL